jgi:hypothetical protein
LLPLSSFFFLCGCSLTFCCNFFRSWLCAHMVCHSRLSRSIVPLEAGIRITMVTMTIVMIIIHHPTRNCRQRGSVGHRQNCTLTNHGDST